MKKKIKDFEEKFEEENGYKVCENAIFFSKIRNNSFLLICNGSSTFKIDCFIQL